MRKLRSGEVDLNWPGHESRSRQALVMVRCAARTEAEKLVAMRNEAKNMARDRKREKARQAMTVYLDDLLSEPEAPTNRALEVLEEVQILLAKVSPAEQKILSALLFSLPTHAEVAAELGLSKHTVRGHLKNIRAKLRPPIQT